MKELSNYRNRLIFKRLTKVISFWVVFMLSQTVTKAQPGDALDFDGSDDVVTVNNYPSLDITSNFTISAWVKLNGTQTNYTRIVSRENSGVGNRQYNLGLGVNGDHPRTVVDLQNGTNGVSVQGTTDITDGNWHHISVSFDQNDSIKIFVDGQQEDASDVSDAVVSKNSIVAFGSIAHTPGNLPLNGKIDEILIWSRTLTSDEIRQNMHQPLNASNQTNLEGYWKFDSGSGQTATDQTSNTNDGELGTSSSNDSNDPSWSTSNAVIGNTTVQGNQDLKGVWVSDTSESSGGLNVNGANLTDTNYIVFAHNGNTGENTNSTTISGITMQSRLNREWIFDDNAGSQTVDLTFTTDQAGVSGGFSSSANDTNYVLINTITNTIAQDGANNIDPNTNTITFNGIDINGNYTVGTKDETNSPLPVELIHFYADKRTNEVELNWATASETNNSHFLIQRKAVGEWQNIGRVEAYGTTYEKQNYTFTDLQVSSQAIQHYRLKQVDFDGNYQYSKIISVIFDRSRQQAQIQLYGEVATNTVKGKITIDQPGRYKLIVMNSKGQLIHSGSKSWKQGDHSFELSLDEASKGMYYLEVVSGEYRVHKKFMMR